MDNFFIRIITASGLMLVFLSFILRNPAVFHIGIALLVPSSLFEKNKKLSDYFVITVGIFFTSIYILSVI